MLFIIPPCQDFVSNVHVKRAGLQACSFFLGGGGGHSEGSLIGALCLCCNNYLLLIQNSCMGASDSATLITQSYQ